MLLSPSLDFAHLCRPAIETGGTPTVFLLFNSLRLRRSETFEIAENMRRCLISTLEPVCLGRAFCVMVLNDVSISIAIDLQRLQIFHALIPFSLRLLIGVE
jgi:hypothetical protein